jgi:hypothetical protein
MNSARNIASSQLEAAKGHRLWRDRLSVSVVALAVAINALAVISVLIRLRPLSYEVPIRYTSVAGFDSLGPWYALYAIPAYGILVLAANVGLAMKAYNRSRIASFFLLLAAVVVALLCLVISNAFVSVV